MKEKINLGKWTEESLDLILKEASGINDPGGRTDFLSKHFLNTAYKESTLIGDINTPEVFVINLEEVDCFTFIDYIEAMRRSRSFNEFKQCLKDVRYHSGAITFKNRNHFFTDWKIFNSGFVLDVTKDVGAGRSRDVAKRLNEKQDGTLFVPGIGSSPREITYLQSVYIDGPVMESLRTGDYIGIYSGKDGLDVSHVGIVIRDRDKVKFRHASSLRKYRMVLDEDFGEYMAGKPGIVVLRPREWTPSPTPLSAEQAGSPARGEGN